MARVTGVQTNFRIEPENLTYIDSYAARHGITKVMALNELLRRGAAEASNSMDRLHDLTALVAERITREK